MEILLDIISGVQGYIIIGLCIICIIFLILIIVLFSSLNKLENRYRRFMRGTNNKNIEELVMGYLDKVDNAEKTCLQVKELYEKIDTRLTGCIQKTSIIRYKAFDDVGSDLSFSVALLDNNNNGVILTGIYARNESTTYAKPIDKGISRYDLSEEEIHVLNDAMNKELIHNKNIK
jgi:hypothetical protein